MCVIKVRSLSMGLSSDHQLWSFRSPLGVADSRSTWWQFRSARTCSLSYTWSSLSTPGTRCLLRYVERRHLGTWIPMGLTNRLPRSFLASMANARYLKPANLLVASPPTPHSSYVHCQKSVALAHEASGEYSYFLPSRSMPRMASASLRATATMATPAQLLALIRS